MCGRFSLRALLDDVKRTLRKRYEIHDLRPDVVLPRYNVAPGQDLLAIVNDGQKNRAGLIRWGFVPSFAKAGKMGAGIINAKAETIREKPAFQSSLERKRCVILADGFYEWKKGSEGKTPMRIAFQDESLFSMAGLWSATTAEDGSKTHTCTIITTAANGIVAPIHDRMPVILTPESEKIWLNPAVIDLDLLTSLLIPHEENGMRAYQVSPIVNNAANDVPECVERIG